MAEVTLPEYRRVDALDAALVALAEKRFSVLAGGTDFYPACAERAPDVPVLDISGIAALRGIEPIADGWRIGALTTWTDIVRAGLPPWSRALCAAACDIGGVQVQNAGTIAGNICNASPAADGVVALLALDARVLLASLDGRREMSLAEFLVGPRQTRCRSDELVTALDIPARSARARSAFTKLGHRRYLVISVAMVAAVIDYDAAGAIDYAGVVVGSCSATARHLTTLEARLVGQPRGCRAANLFERADLDVLSPIDDLRGTREYRLDAVATLVRRVLGAASA